MFQWLFNLFAGRGRGVEELARRVDLPAADLRRFEVQYREFTIRKRSGGVRPIAAPLPELKSLQRRLLRRLLNGLKTHPAATGFTRGQSFVSNARRHEGRAVVIHFDIKDFFPSIPAQRVRRYFRKIGWNRPAANLLTRLCTWQDRLPQGAPTSPRLSNLVNYRLDARLAGLADKYHGVYTRYADDITISLAADDWDLRPLIATALKIIREEGYRPHVRKKFDVRRRHQRQEVTGLVVNRRANLSRRTRRWLRAVAHRSQQYYADRAAASASAWQPRKRPTLSPEQLAGWQALQQMIERQAAS